ncbi:MAG: hypothetical protein H6780_03590 [Candidatus Nomurabacteria bacterium]|nr:MAG: hypothetical protein H6780_03590 [Candidatus Nomurabacteria bacterium]
MKKLRRLDPNTVVLLKHIGLGVVMVGVVALIVTGIWYGTRVPSLTITKVEAVGGETIDTKSIVRIAESKLEGEYIGLIPHRFVWLYPDDLIKEEIRSIDRIHNVQLWRSDTTLRITFDEYVPAALWCTAVATENCVFVDAAAYAFSSAPRLDGGSFLRFITTDKPATVGEMMLDKETYHIARELEQLLATKGWFVSQIEIDQVGDAFLTLAEGGELKTALDSSPQETVDNLFVVLTSKEFTHLRPGNFVYIDLRFGNKVFVKEKETTPEGVEEIGQYSPLDEARELGSDEHGQ